ncbi:Zinc knuckle [Popillia japonica]|uniref:Zinc knuckle n=1 Tax=Popillia japonica TaxID=7064 RepID=A0AAW1L1V4_POPJA
MSGDHSQSELDFEMGDGNSSGDERADDLRRRDLLLIVARMMEKQTAAFMAALAKKEPAVVPTDLSTADGSGLQSVATGGNSIGSIPSTTGEVIGAVARRGWEARMGGDILEPFDPDEADWNVERWVSKIDQLGEIYGWSPYERAYFAQGQLKGAARKWFNYLDDYGLTWEQWKAELKKAFPRREDYDVQLEELVARRKLPNETLASYYHAKMALLGRCRITGEDAVSILIRGLPVELRAAAHSTRCATPAELYTNYLAGITGYQAAVTPSSSSGATKNEAVRRKAQPLVASRVKRVADDEKQEVGNHYSRDCTKARVDRCRVCRGEGHLARDCPKRRESSKRVSLISCTTDAYKKWATTTRGERVKAYLDTGAERSLVTLDCVRRLGLASRCIIATSWRRSQLSNLQQKPVWRLAEGEQCAR